MNDTLKTLPQRLRATYYYRNNDRVVVDVGSILLVLEERDQLLAKLNSPELLSFRDAVVLEAAHQRERWGSEHDAGKEPQDWFWLLGYLAGKALHACLTGNKEKALHHTISAAAALNNWHAAILGANNEMRPGISPEKQKAGE